MKEDLKIPMYLKIYFEEILIQAIQVCCVDSRIQIVDSNHVKAHSNRHKNQKVTIEKEVKNINNP